MEIHLYKRKPDTERNYAEWHLENVSGYREIEKEFFDVVDSEQTDWTQMVIIIIIKINIARQQELMLI